MNIVFVVLHYESLNDTKECVDSLVNYINRNNAHVVIVDNGSQKGKLNELEPIYQNNKNIYFLYSSENLGFAKGNNIGFCFAKKELNADIIVLCNNDLIFKQEDFCEKLEMHATSGGFDSAGPKIMSLVDGKNQNPVPVQYATLKELKKRIFKYRVLLFFSFVNLDVVLQKIAAKEIEEYHPKKDEDFQLFGACLIFGKNYIDQFDGLYDGTFMYAEECILKERIKRSNMSMVYYDDLEVFHKEGSSTGATYGKGIKKRQFYYKCSIASCNILKKIKMGIISCC